MSDKVFVDTNVFVYLFDRDAPAKQQRARQIVQQEGQAGNIVLSTQVLQEFYVTVTRKLGKRLSESDAVDAARDLCAFDVVDLDRDAVMRSMDLSRTDRISFWDALIVDAARARNCSRLLTEDLQDGRAFGSVTVANPFLK
jgi:predicted nucleic acid-binding protein